MSDPLQEELDLDRDLDPTDETAADVPDEAPEPVTPRTLRPYQIEAADAVENDWANDIRRTSVVLPTGSGKALADNTVMVTPDGITTHGQLRVGDRVYGPDGHPRVVIMTHPQPVMDLYRVRFSDGTYLDATDNHLWSVSTLYGVELTLTTKELRSVGLRHPVTGRPRWTIPYTPRCGRLRGRPPRTITRITRIGQGPSQCITVNHPDGLYLAGKHRAATHNSSVAGEIVNRARARGLRVAMLAHRAELLGQLRDNVHAVNPDIGEVGIVMAERNETEPDIVAASFQTLAASQKRIDALGQRDVIVVDECFVAGTLVDGKPIEDYRVGDRVRAVNETTGETTLSEVTRTFVSEPSSLVEVTLSDGQVFYCTPNHPFLTHDLRWVAACNLAAGERLHYVNSTPCLVNDVVSVPRGSLAFSRVCPNSKVYNLEVAGLHTYTVGTGVTVHNCHHITAPSYMSVLSRLGAGNPDPLAKDKTTDDNNDPTAFTVGLTATMYRADGTALGNVWENVCYEKDIEWAIESGFLVPPKAKTVHIPALDELGSIKNVAGDYNSVQLEEVMSKSASVRATVDAVKKHASDRAMIVFASSVAHSEVLAAALTEGGIPAVSVTGGDSHATREQRYELFNSGKVQALVTVMVLTEGADFPRCDCVVMGRPTRSQVLFSQMTGRSLRLYTDPTSGKDKPDALVLDLVGTVRDKKLVSLTDLWGAAETSSFDDKGNELPAAEPDPDTPREPEPDPSDDDVELVDYDLRAQHTSDRVLTLLSPKGLVFVPSGKGANGLALWPPTPHLAERVYLLHVTPQFVEAYQNPDGTLVSGSAEQMSALAREAAVAMKSDDGRGLWVDATAPWRAPGRRPTASQKNLCAKIGVRVTPSMSMGDVSDAISSAFFERLITKHYYTIQDMNLN